MNDLNILSRMMRISITTQVVTPYIAHIFYIGLASFEVIHELNKTFLIRLLSQGRCIVCMFKQEIHKKGDRSLLPDVEGSCLRVLCLSGARPV